MRAPESSRPPSVAKSVSFWDSDTASPRGTTPRKSSPLARGATRSLRGERRPARSPPAEVPIAAKESAVVLSPPAASASGEALARLAEYARSIGTTHQLALQAPALVHSVRTASEGPASQAARAALVAHASRFVHFGDAVDARALEQAVRLCDAMEGQGSLQAALATSTAARVEERDPSIVAPGGRAMASSTDSSSSLPASAAPPKEGAIARLARKATERRQARIIARLAKASVRARTAVSCLCGKGDDIPDAAVNLVAELVVFAGAAEEDRAASAVIVLAAVEAAFGLELPIDAACLGAVDSLGNAKAGPSFAYSQLEAVLAALPSWGRDSDAAAQAGRVQAQLRRLHSRCGFGPGVDEVWGVRLCGGLFG